ncbi:hypothetical protein G4Z13_13025 [Enterococcus faecium]|nr:hypothetical protein [Enterococcus faecium]MBW1625271.1 hypothetical protein [Enterococcus faecium]MBW1631243.1 hypothetical protein [Enterococcus faecium]MBW1634219.1 hypothetical protein [Enterococcus faecium]MBW1653324.1 hypothetical protein [Enterococcus faecium]MBW1663039.1 hypothetical protein [Enterococcus faecium]
MSNDIQPEIRFPGFTEAWEQRKFECLLDKKDGVRRGPFGSALKKEFFVSNSNFVVYEQQNAIYDNYETRYKITEKKYNELIKFNRIRQKSPILYRWVMNAVRYEGYRW